MKLKICGIRDLNILQYACEAGVDFVGFIMANDSPRKISNDFLESLETFDFKETSPVFVFVNPSVEEVKKIITKIAAAQPIMSRVSILCKYLIKIACNKYHNFSNIKLNLIFF